MQRLLIALWKTFLIRGLWIMTTINGYSDQLVTTVKNSGAFERYPDWSRPMARQLAREACRRLELDEISQHGVALKGLSMEALSLSQVLLLLGQEPNFPQDGEPLAMRACQRMKVDEKSTYGLAIMALALEAFNLAKLLVRPLRPVVELPPGISTG
jgi:hypothetical protein